MNVKQRVPRTFYPPDQVHEGLWIDPVLQAALDRLKEQFPSLTWVARSTSRHVYLRGRNYRGEAILMGEPGSGGIELVASIWAECGARFFFRWDSASGAWVKYEARRTP